MERRATDRSEEKRTPAGAGEASPSRKSEKDGEFQARELGYGKKADQEEDEEEEAFRHESVRKKMGVLARMVGMEGCGGQPAAVLTEVVRVLKELDGQARVACSPSER